MIKMTFGVVLIMFTLNGLLILNYVQNVFLVTPGQFQLTVSKSDVIRLRYYLLVPRYKTGHTY